MRRLLLPLLAVAALLAGCGGQHTTTTRSAPQPAPTVPEGYTQCSDGTIVRAEAGACIKHELGENLQLVAPLTAGPRAQCIDISRWQPHPQFGVLHRQGIRCVIVQGAADAHASNPFFDSQIRSAHEAGLLVGVYIFAEGAPGKAQADALIAVASSERSRITLGAGVDAEVDVAYAHVCAISHELERSFYLVYVYGSPGTYQGGHCTKYVWPAIWGTRSPVPLPGYSSSAIVFWQWCGTCRLAGNDGEIDRDEDRGLIALSHPAPPPKPLTPKQKKAKEHTLEHLLGAYDRRHNPHGHNCQHPPFKHAYPSARFNHACAVWAHQLAALKGEHR